jgi:hypothetical protein
MRVADLKQKVEQNLQDLAKQVEDLKVQVSKLEKAKGALELPRLPLLLTY